MSLTRVSRSDRISSTVEPQPDPRMILTVRIEVQNLNPRSVMHPRTETRWWRQTGLAKIVFVFDSKRSIYRREPSDRLFFKGSLLRTGKSKVQCFSSSDRTKAAPSRVAESCRNSLQCSVSNASITRLTRNEKTESSAASFVAASRVSAR